MRSLKVVPSFEFFVDQVQMPLRYHYKSIETLDLQSLNEPFYVRPQIRRRRRVPFDLSIAGFEDRIVLRRVFGVVVPQDILRRQLHVVRVHQEVSGLLARPGGVLDHPREKHAVPGNSGLRSPRRLTASSGHLPEPTHPRDCAPYSLKSLSLDSELRSS